MGWKEIIASPLKIRFFSMLDNMFRRMCPGIVGDCFLTRVGTIEMIVSNAVKDEPTAVLY